MIATRAFPLFAGLSMTRAEGVITVAVIPSGVEGGSAGPSPCGLAFVWTEGDRGDDHAAQWKHNRKNSSLPHLAFDINLSVSYTHLTLPTTNSV